jgi:hypothetical protein
MPLRHHRPACAEGKVDPLVLRHVSFCLSVLGAMVLWTATSITAGCGWYLLVPPRSQYNEKAPFLRGINILTDSPLSKWNHEGSYDSSEVCETAKTSQILREQSVYAKSVEHHQELLREKTDVKVLALQRLLTEQHSANVDALMAARCIASDDPRLR